MKLILLIAILFSVQSADAQFGKRLKDRAKEAAERKANQKADEAINKGADKIDSVITGKKRDKTGKTKTENTQSTTGNTSDNNESTDNIETSYKEVVVKTNIRCETGKKKLETVLRNTDGVSSAMIDYDNGNLYLSSENPDVRNKVVELIRQNGFEADGKKPTKIFPNPCK